MEVASRWYKPPKAFFSSISPRFSASTTSHVTLAKFLKKGPAKQDVGCDITYVPTDEGWLYLAGHKGLFTSEIVSYAMGERLTRNLVNQPLLQAVTTRRPGKGLLHHSDRGSQYCSHEYQGLLKQFGLEVSMSGSENCFDNAPMESFWGIIKQELINHRHYRSWREAMDGIAEYIEIFYNRQRLQAKLGCLSPAAYEQQCHSGLLAK